MIWIHHQKVKYTIEVEEERTGIVYWNCQRRDKFVLDIGSLNNSDSESLCEVADNRETYIITCLICVFILKRL